MTILSFGGGQDSTAILYKIIYDPVFKKKYVTGHFHVVMSDTMNEHPETYQHVKNIIELCREHSIPFTLIHPSNGYHIEGWSRGLINFYEEGDRVGSKCFPKSCTDQLKIRPIYKWLDEYVHKFGYGKRNSKGILSKTAIKQFAEEKGKINMIIGIAKGEEKRVAKDSGKPVWMKNSIQNIYPLIEEDMGRQECIDYISSVGMEVPIPSNCILCPFMNHIELLYLYRFHENWYHRWVKIEQNKIDANKHVEKNSGVFGMKLLPEILKEAIEKHGHMTDEEVREYRFSHGHCVASAY